MTFENESETKTLQRRENDRQRKQIARANESEAKSLQRRTSQRQRDRIAHENELQQSRNIRLLATVTNNQQRPPRVINYRKACNELNDVVEGNIEEFYCGPLKHRCEFCGSKNFKGEKTPILIKSF